VAGWAHVASAQTADAVIEKSVTALGGRAALQKIKSRAMDGAITLSTPVGDVEGTIEIYNAVPNKTRTVIKADLTSLGAGPFVLDQRFDGNVGYAMDSLQGNRDITGNQLDNLRNSSFPHSFLNYKDKGIAVTLADKEKVGDRDAFVVIFEPTTGSTIRQYIDAESYLPLRTVAKVFVQQLGQDVEQMTDFLDYRDVDGVKTPFKLRATSAVQNYTIVLAKVEHNVQIDDALFSKPAAK
jgi:outer membrane lipoprotein-sorting protein